VLSIYGKSWRRWKACPIHLISIPPRGICKDGEYFPSILFLPLQKASARMESALHLFLLYLQKNMHGWRALPIHYILRSHEHLHR
jgi:hypothetical protein